MIKCERIIIISNFLPILPSGPEEKSLMANSAARLLELLHEENSPVDPAAQACPSPTRCPVVPPLHSLPLPSPVLIFVRAESCTEHLRTGPEGA